MHPPCELMVDSFLPAMRQIVARRLSEEGMSQGRIAGLMGVTQASVSLYLRSEKRDSDLLRSLGIGEDEAGLYASLLTEDLKKNPVYAVNTLYSLWSDLLGRGSMCEPHRSLYPQLAECQVCIKAFGGRDTRPGDAIEHVAEAVRMVPEVSVNIAYAPEGASSVQEIVAVPGRIVKVRGTARSFMKPEYGASTHVASVLLVAMSHDPLVRAAMNLRYDDKMMAVLRRLGLDPLVLKEDEVKNEADMMRSLRSAVRAASKPVRSVVDPGAPGLEPGLYLFAGDALAVARQGLELARAYRERP
jgi:predicted fused transcriptional regulator/phosphomethylpyrimidine kinase/predicted transcriptional regulator